MVPSQSMREDRDMPVSVAITALNGTKEKAVELSDIAFGATFNEPLVHQVVIAHQAGERCGTRAQKNRASVRGGSGKPWRQKGTGRARSGTIRSPIFRGGGRAFPASTRDFSHKVNRKMYRAAMRAILSELNRQSRLVLIDDLVVDPPKTRVLANFLAEIDAEKSLIVLAEMNSQVALSARNLQSVSVCTSREVNPLNLLLHEKVVMTSEAVKMIDRNLQDKQGESSRSVSES